MIKINAVIYLYFTFFHTTKGFLDYDLNFAEIFDETNFNRHHNDDEKDYVDQENQDYFNIDKKSGKKQDYLQDAKQAICKAKPYPIKSKKGDIIDSEISECDWYQKGLIIICSFGHINQLHLILQNVNNKQTTIQPKENLEKNQNQHYLLFEENDIVHIINQLYVKHNDHRFLSGFIIEYFSGYAQRFTCPTYRELNYHIKKKVKISQLQSLAGITYQQKAGYIYKLNFHLNQLIETQGYTYEDMTYKYVAKNYQLVHEYTKNNVQQDDIIGTRHGQNFTDRRLNDSWQVTQIIINTNGHQIAGIQTIFQQKYFSVKVENESHICARNFQNKDFKKLTIDIGKEDRVKEIQIYMHQRYICGLVFVTENSKSENFCQKYDKVKSFQFKNTETFIGFQGYKNDFQILGLGIYKIYSKQDFVNDWGKSNQINFKLQNIHKLKQILINNITNQNDVIIQLINFSRFENFSEFQRKEKDNANQFKQDF